MFAEACEKASKFTRPVIISTRCVDGSVNSSLGSFVIINRDGWIVTAGHVFDMYAKFMEDQKRLKEFNDRKDSYASKDPKWITNHSFWWGWDNVQVGEAYVNREIDIAVGKLVNFKPEMISLYPKFKNPDKIKPGTSLCRTGFAFMNETLTEFDDSKQAFRIRPGVIPIPFFPNDGIHTRNIFMGKSRDGDYEKLYIETSTPGVRGQSGGPIFDKYGYIAGIQVRTEHMPLGFTPAVNVNGKDVIENQFMNLGVGVHVKTLMKIFDSKGVKYDSELNEQGFRIID